MALVGVDGDDAAATDFAGIELLGATIVLRGAIEAARATGEACAIALLAAGAGRAVNPRCSRCKLK
jgi:hypothetical protein